MPATPETPVPPSRPRVWSRGLRLRLVVYVLLVVFGWLAWSRFTFRDAVLDAKALGWSVGYDDPLDKIRENWRAAFSPATWSNESHVIGLTNAADLKKHIGLIRRLAPRSLTLDGELDTAGIALLKSLGDVQVTEITIAPSVTSLDQLTGIRGLRTLGVTNNRTLKNLDGIGVHTGLDTLWLTDCPALANVDGLAPLTKLRWLTLHGCGPLANLNALKGLSSLEGLNLMQCTTIRNLNELAGLRSLNWLTIHHCTQLTNVDTLANLAAVERLEIGTCPGLTNLDSLKSLTTLQVLKVNDCPGLTNLDALAGLSLRELHVSGCTGLSQGTLTKLKTTLQLKGTSVVAY